jgi:broad specificity phosphatase PhoE
LYGLDDFGMGVIYLVRHAQAPRTAYGSPVERAAGENMALTALGCEQARRMGEALLARAGRVDYAISGQLPRQRRTLEIALSACSPDVSPEQDAGWDEYDIDALLGGGGRAARATGPALQTLVDAALGQWVTARHPTGALETYAEYQNRCTAAMENARALAGPGKTVLVVSSSGSITQVLARLLGLDGQHWIRLGRTMINASITKLIVGRSGVSVVSVNEHGHLESVKDASDGPPMTFR